MNRNNTFKQKITKFIDIIIMAWILIDIVLLIAMYFINFNNYYFAFVIFDTLLCVVLFAQFILKIRSINDKRQYLRDDKRGIIIDILAMIPYELITFGTFGFFRLLRLVRIFALLGKQKREIYNFIEKTKLNYIILSFTVFVIGSSLLILVLENSPGSEIRTPLEAVWYVMSTITTVGYGDITPITFDGRIFGIILMVFGVVFFSVLTASISTWFLRGIESEEEELKIKIVSMEKSMNELKSDIKEMKKILKEE